MKLANEIELPADPERTWAALLDLERVARCLPGATLAPDRHGDAHRGTLTVKLGPLSLSYAGTARIVEIDEDARATTLEVQAHEANGQGSATATIHSRLSGADGRTHIAIETDLVVTGRPAQLGGGIMEEVAARMLDELAANLAREVADGDIGRAAPAQPSGDNRPAHPPSGDGEPRAAAPAAPPLDLGRLAAGPLLRRAAPVAGAAVALAALAALAAVVITRRRPRRRLVITWR